MPTEPLLTSIEVGLRIGRSPRTVARLAEAGTLPIAQKLPGPNGALLFRTSDVEVLVRHYVGKTPVVLLEELNAWIATDEMTA